MPHAEKQFNVTRAAKDILRPWWSECRTHMPVDTAASGKEDLCRPCTHLISSVISNATTDQFIALLHRRPGPTAYALAGAVTEHQKKAVFLRRVQL